MSRKMTLAFLVVIIANAMVLGVNLNAALLEKKEDPEPCLQALEEIAEVVNERLGDE